MAYIPTKKISVATLSANLEKIEKTKKMSDVETELLMLVRIGRLAMNVEEFEVRDTKEVLPPEKEVTSYYVVAGMHNRIRTNVLWEAKITEAARQMMIKNREQLKKSLSNDMYVWAWFELQLNDAKSAKQTLLGSYEKEFQKVMHSDDDGRPFLRLAEEEADALKGLLSEGEHAEVKKKVDKMKVYVSKQRYSEMMT
jgi:hypothetical protein